jgi:mono/diheme cytochrome c family protein
VVSRWAATRAAVVALAAAAGGCGSKPDYPPNLVFPSRTDRLVLKTPETPPAAQNEPGKLDEDLARLDSLGGKTALPADLPAATRTDLDRFLKDAFGTPAAPKVGGEPDATAAAEGLGLTPDQLAEGGKLYRKHCLQCHNLTGDGRGPSGFGGVPPPRDFRRGAFKFVSTGHGAKPRRADLVRTLTEGLKGTIMPSFGLLPEGERELMAKYVTYLAVRGETEYQALAAHLGGPGDPSAPPESRVGPILAEWVKAEQAPPVPAAPDDGEPGSASHYDAVRRGHALFTAKAENSCVTCHEDFGRKPVLRYDVWGTVAKPADLTATNVIKGGARDQDLYARVRFGIAPVGMPAHPELTDRQVWDLVRFVQSAPYPVRLPEDVRAAVHPRP